MDQRRASKLLESALTVHGFHTDWDAHRVVFTSTDEPRRTVSWRISPEALSRRAAVLQPDAQDAWGSSEARGEWLLAVHLEEALRMFEGARGEIDMEPWGLRVRPLE